MLNKWLSAVLSVGLLMSLVACGEEAAPQKVEKASGTAKKEQKKETKKEFNMNETIQLGSHKLTVTKVDKSQGNDFDKPKSGNEYVIVHVKIENGGKDQIDYNPLDFQLKNSQGNITDVAFSMVDQDTALDSGQLAPGGKVEGTITFEAPKNDNKLQLLFTPSFWSDKKIVVNLQ